MTIFAAATPPDAVQSAPSNTQNAPADAAHPKGRRPHESLENSQGEETSCKRIRTNMPEHDQNTHEHNTNGNMHNNQNDPKLPPTNTEHQDTHDTEISQTPQQVIDLASQKHGPLFMQLSKEEQAWLLKLQPRSPGKCQATGVLQTIAVSRTIAKGNWRSQVLNMSGVERSHHCSTKCNP